MKKFYEKYWKKQLPEMGFFGNQPTKEQSLQEINLIKKWIIEGYLLDYGCGEGHLVNSLLYSHGVDISEEAVRKAKKLYPTKMFCTIENIPDNLYYNVTACDVFEHIFDFDDTFDFINSHLVVGGRLIVSTNEIGFLKMCIIGAFFKNTFFHPYSPHIRYFTKKTLSDLLISKGYKVIHSEHRGKYFGIISKGLFMVAERVR